MRDRNRLLKDQVTDPHWYSALEAQMAASPSEIIANRAQALVAAVPRRKAMPKPPFRPQSFA